MGDHDPDRTAALRLEYEDLVRERDRLRDARRSVTSALGPLPAASAVAVGLFGLVKGRIDDWMIGVYIAVLALFVFMAAAGAIAISRSSYRELRDGYVNKLGLSLAGASVPDWLAQMINLETGVYEDLVDGFEFERKWLLRMQWAAVLQVTLLGVITVGSFLSD